MRFFRESNWVLDNWHLPSSSCVYLPIFCSITSPLSNLRMMRAVAVVALLIVNAVPSSCYGAQSLFKSDRFTALSMASVIDVRNSLLSILDPSTSSFVDDKSEISDVTTNKPSQYSKMRELVSILELSQTRDLTFPALWTEIDGDWDLKYTNNAESFVEGASGLSGGVLDKRRSNIVNVIQRITSASNIVDHVLQYTIPFTSLSGTVTLRHDMSVMSDTSPAQLAIDLSEMIVEGPLNPLQLPPIRLPGPSYLRRGVFDVRQLHHRHYLNLTTDNRVADHRLQSMHFGIYGLMSIVRSFSCG